MTTVYLAPTFGVGYQSFTNGGLPNNVGFIYTWQSGASTTPQATYTTSAGNVQNANPIVLDASGRPPSEIWLVSNLSYRFEITDSLGNIIKTYDNIAGINDGQTNYLPLAGGTMTGDIVMNGASIIEAEGSPVTAASSTNIWATDGNTRHVTGNTGIADFATAPQIGAWMKVIFDGTPLLTNSANLNLNAGGANIQIRAGDFAIVYADTTTQMDVFVTRADGTPLIIGNRTIAAGSLDGAQTSGPPIFGIRAFCTWDGTTAGTYTPSLPSGNIISVARIGVGLYTLSFITNMPTAEYAAAFDLEGITLILGIAQTLYGPLHEIISKSNSAITVQFYSYLGSTNTPSAYDPTRCHMMIIA